MKLRFLGATGTVTGSKYYLQQGDTAILIDCGLFQGLKNLRLRNWQTFPIDPAKLQAVVLTHAHIDHSGYLPKLVKEGFNGKIFCTRGTHALCEILLPDSAHLQQEEADYANRKGYSKHHPAQPLYTEKDVRRTLKHFRAMDYGKPFNIGTLSISFEPAGHILGAASVRINNGKKTVTFSGDIGRPNDLLMQPPAPLADTDYLIVESTYGDRLHPLVDVEQQMQAIVQETCKQGGVILIPSFAVGRAQSILYLLSRLRNKNRIPPVPIYLDSPMAIDATQLLRAFHAEHRLSHSECKAIFDGVNFVHNVEASKALHQQNQSMIIVSASGMLTGGRILHHMRRYAPDKKNAIVLVGYQAAGTRGYNLAQGANEIKMLGEYVQIHARIYSIDGLSAHADYRELGEWLRTIPHPPKKTFVTHGEPQAADAFRLYIKDQLGWNVEVPEYLSSYTV